jgi:hypothetical protein
MRRGRGRQVGALLAFGWIALEPLWSWAGEPVRSVDIVESMAFLEGYRAASAAQSPDFYDFYSDRAVIHARIQHQDKGVAFQGRAYKQWGRELLVSGRAALDGSVFRDATVEQRGTRLVIRAKRYSTTRCYWDPTYQVGIEKEGASYRIVDERFTTNPAAQCVPGRASADPRVVSLVPAEFSAPPGYPSTRVVDTPTMPAWHPLSQEELAGEARQLAQAIVAARPPGRPTNPAPLTVVVNAAGPSGTPQDPALSAATRRVDPPSDLRIPPQD